MGLQTLDDIANDDEDTPPVGHSITGLSTGHLDHKGSTSPGGASLPQSLNQAQKYKFSNLKRSAWSDQQVERYLARLDRIHYYLEDDEKFLEKMDKASLAQIALMEGLVVDKLHTLTGKATQIISIQQQNKMDELLPALQEALKQRGLTVTATERTIEVNTERIAGDPRFRGSQKDILP